MLNIQVSDGFRVGLDELAAWIHRVAHQHVEGPIRLRRILHRDQEQGPVFGIHRRLPQLDRVHFAQAFITLHRCLVTDLFKDLVFILVSVCILDLILMCDPIQRRLGNLKMSILH